MSVPTLSPDILLLIVQEFIALNTPPPRFAPRVPDRTQLTNFAPRFYLLPLLLVSQQWCNLISQDLFSAIGSGTPAPFTFQILHRETVAMYMVRHEGARKQKRLRTAYAVLLDIEKKLIERPMKAQWVRTLRLGTEDSSKDFPSAVHLSIIKLCPNLQHVEIRGIYKKYRAEILTVLRARELYTLSVSTTPLQSLEEHPIRTEMPSVFAALRDWPKLRSLTVSRLFSLTIPETFVPTQSCPNLHEIDLHGPLLSADGIRALRTMCSPRVTKLGLTVELPVKTGTRKADAEHCTEVTSELSECLRAWSSTLVSFRLSAGFSLPSFFATMNDDLSSLTHLVDLSTNIKLNFMSISQLPFLKTLDMTFEYSGPEILAFEGLLDEYFPSLKELSFRPSKTHTYSLILNGSCKLKNITIF